MDTKQTLYDGTCDEQFTQPYIDVDEWRSEPVKHRYVHGGFENTGTRFCFYFPEMEIYKGRFFQKLQPVQGPETEAQSMEGEEDMISFSVLHGAYFVESNLGGLVNGGGDASVLYRCSAQTAQFSRKVAIEMYGEHHPYGYIFGGSGGGYKTMSCAENTIGIWDGAVPFVIGSPMALPTVYTVRAHAMRILRNKLSQIADALEPGGSGDPYSCLNEEEADALREATAMGFPMETWCVYKTLDEGALPLLAPAIGMMDPGYYEDFWTKEGYLGTEVNSSAVRDRIQQETVIESIHYPEAGFEEIAESIDEKNQYGVDEAWKHLFGKAGNLPVLGIKDFPEEGYNKGLAMTFLDGALAGQKIDLMWLDKNVVTAKSDITGRNLREILSHAHAGDRVKLDNSDYIASQSYHRHQVPGPEFHAWDQFRYENGTPIYPQREVLVSPMIALGGAGSIQQGTPNCKLIVVESLMDESAFPWQADWYRKEICKNRGTDGNEILRVWQMEHSMHTDCDPSNGGDHQHIISYYGAVLQALLELSDWVERGIEPSATSGYTVNGGEVTIPASAKERKGVQPVVCVKACAGDRESRKGKLEIRQGETVRFEAAVELPEGSGNLELVHWNFEEDNHYVPQGTMTETTWDNDGIGHAEAYAEHTFTSPGVYFPVVKAASNRTAGDIFTRIWNQARIRIVVDD